MSDAAPGRRREFVRTFVEHAWAKPTAEQLTVRPHILVLLTVLTAAGALGSGILWAMLRPADPGKRAPADASRTKAPTAYTAVSGWDCGTGDHGFEAFGRTADWVTVDTGGWTRDGCRGTFESLPMSGSATKEDPQQYALWWFTPGNAYNRCTISVYVPDSGDRNDAGSVSAQFSVLTGPGGTPYASFVIDQLRHPGEWIDDGTYPINQGQVAVKLVDRGVPVRSGARLAFAQVRATCTS